MVGAFHLRPTAVRVHKFTLTQDNNEFATLFCEINQVQTNAQPTLLRSFFAKLN